MTRDLIRVMHAFFLPMAQACRETRWCPPADVYRTRAGWLVKLDLAGVRLEDVQFSVHGNELIVTGNRRDSLVEEFESHYRLEIAYNHFERHLELPCELEHARVTAEFQDGMLLVRINTEEATP